MVDNEVKIEVRLQDMPEFQELVTKFYKDAWIAGYMAGHRAAGYWEGERAWAEAAFEKMVDEEEAADRGG